MAESASASKSPGRSGRHIAGGPISKRDQAACVGDNIERQAASTATSPIDGKVAGLVANKDSAGDLRRRRIQQCRSKGKKILQPERKEWTTIIEITLDRPRQTKVAKEKEQQVGWSQHLRVTANRLEIAAGHTRKGLSSLPASLSKGERDARSGEMEKPAGTA